MEPAHRPDSPALAAPGEPPGRDDLADGQRAESGLCPGARPQRSVLPDGGPVLWQVLWKDTDPPPTGLEAGVLGQPQSLGGEAQKHPQENP